MKQMMSKANYIFINYVFSGLLTVFYNYTLFKSLLGFYTKTSIIVYYLIVILFVSVGIFFSIGKNRNALTAFLNAAFPLQFYAFMSYWKYFPRWAGITVTVAVILSSLFMITALFIRKIPPRKNTFKILFHRFKRAFTGTRLVATVCLCAFTMPLTVNTLFGGSLLRSKNVEVTFQTTDWSEWSVEKNVETLLKTQPEVWQNLSFSQRLDVLTTVMNIEIYHLGINHPLKLTANNTEDSILGFYNVSNKEIVLNIRHVQEDSVDEVLFTLIHECHHAMTRRMVELLEYVPDEYENLDMFLDARTYQHEYSNYIRGESDYKGYASQFCETDADDYAAYSLNYYKRLISDYNK